MNQYVKESYLKSLEELVIKKYLTEEAKNNILDDDKNMEQKIIFDVKHFSEAAAKWNSWLETQKLEIIALTEFNDKFSKEERELWKQYWEYKTRYFQDIVTEQVINKINK